MHKESLEIAIELLSQQIGLMRKMSEHNENNQLLNRLVMAYNDLEELLKWVWEKK